MDNKKEVVKGWVIRIERDGDTQAYFLYKLQQDGGCQLTNRLANAKVYKSSSYVEKAVRQINNIPKLQAMVEFVR